MDNNNNIPRCEIVGSNSNCSMTMMYYTVFDIKMSGLSLYATSDSNRYTNFLAACCGKDYSHVNNSLEHRSATVISAHLLSFDHSIIQRDSNYQSVPELLLIAHGWAHGDVPDTLF